MKNSSGGIDFPRCRGYEQQMMGMHSVREQEMKVV